MGDFIAPAFLRLLDPGSQQVELTEPELLVRETAQNSWDARRTDLDAPVMMSFDVVNLQKGSSEHGAFTNFYGDYLKQRSNKRRQENGLGELAKKLEAQELSVLYVRDVGTWGLGGPTDASVAVATAGTDRYVKFMLNIGDANTDAAAGGAFGLGRSVFWRMSECRTVIVYTRCKTGKSIESRLVGLTLTDKFAHDGINYTGRHWWTASDAGKPLVGPDADEWSRLLGITPYSVGETGTTVIVVAPITPSGTDDLASAIAGSIEYHLWPKYVDIQGRRPKDTMSFSASINGEPLKIRDRADLRGSVLGSYVECFARLVKLAGERSVETSSESIVKSTNLSYKFQKLAHPRELGRLVTKVDSSAAEPSGIIDSDEENQSFAQLIRTKLATLDNSIALMRTPELVVCYESIRPQSDSPVRVVGVFKSSEAANEYFRRAEDSSHGSWRANRAPQDKQIVVKRFHEVLKQQIIDWYGTQRDGAVSGGSTLAIDRMASGLGKWFRDWGRGSGGGSPTKKSSNGNRGDGGSGGIRTSNGRLEIEALPVEAIDGKPVNVWRLTATHEDPSAIQVGLREADEDGVLMKSVNVAPGAFPAFVKLESDVEIIIEGVALPTRRHVFDVGPTKVNVTDLLIHLVGSGTTTITVRAVPEDGTFIALVADLNQAPAYGDSK